MQNGNNGGKRKEEGEKKRTNDLRSVEQFAMCAHSKLPLESLRACTDINRRKCPHFQTRTAYAHRDKHIQLCSLFPLWQPWRRISDQRVSNSNPTFSTRMKALCPPAAQLIEKALNSQHRQRKWLSSCNGSLCMCANHIIKNSIKS